MFFVCILDMLLCAMPEILLLTDDDLPVPVEESLIFEFQNSSTVAIHHYPKQLTWSCLVSWDAVLC